MSSVPEGERKQGKLEVIVKAEDLCLYTLQITANENIFLPKYIRTTVDIENAAKAIYHNAFDANNIYVKTAADYEQRRHLQNQAILACGRLLATLQIAKKLYHLRDKRIKFWTQKIVDTRKLLRAWKDSDAKRYG